MRPYASKASNNLLHYVQTLHGLEPQKETLLAIDCHRNDGSCSSTHLLTVGSHNLAVTHKLLCKIKLRLISLNVYWDGSNGMNMKRKSMRSIAKLLLTELKIVFLTVVSKWDSFKISCNLILKRILSVRKHKQCTELSKSRSNEILLT